MLMYWSTESNILCTGFGNILQNVTEIPTHKITK